MPDPEVSCHDCFGACCIGPQTMQLSLMEKGKLEQAGTKFQTVAEPVGYVREDVIYPVGMEVYEDDMTFRWIVNPNDPYEPLPAWFGRYMMIGACGWLRDAADGSRYCGTYETRPRVCQDFEEGGKKCIFMREVQIDLLPRSR